MRTKNVFLCLFISASFLPSPGYTKTAETLDNGYFKNLTYTFPACTEMGAPQAIPLKNGKFEQPRAIEVSIDKILYGSLGAAKEKVAVISLSCDPFGANYSIRGFFVFSSARKLLGRIDESSLTAEYKKQFNTLPTLYLSNALPPKTGNDLEIQEGTLFIRSEAEGTHSNPDNIITFKYSLNPKQHLILKEKITVTHKHETPSNNHK